MPGARRPEDAVKFILEAAATGKLCGVMVAMVFSDDHDVDVRICGHVKHGDLVWAGAVLNKEGIGG